MGDYYNSDSDSDDSYIEDIEIKKEKEKTPPNHLQIIPYQPPPNTSHIEYVLMGILGALSIIYKIYR